MEKRASVRIVVSVILVLVIVGFAFAETGSWKEITGKVIDGLSKDEGGFGGPSAEDSACLRKCVVEEGREEDVCMAECGVEPKPEPADEGEKCMQECIFRGCDEERDFNCQRANLNSCEDECGMKGDAPDESEMSEEQRCISDCVNAIDPTIICGSGSFEGEGETGGDVCQRCADECVHLYAGPCLTDELWREKEDDCMAKGEHMEAIPVMGDSGQGYECTVEIECIDRSDEFGDDAGEGPGIGQEGYVAPNAVLGVVDNVVGFFRGLFGGGTEEINNGE